MKILEGVAGAAGVVRGTAVVCCPARRMDTVPYRPVTDAAAEVWRFRAALARTVEQLHRLLSSYSDTERDVLEVYLTMLQGADISEPTMARIREGEWAPSALRWTILGLQRRLEAADDAYIGARAADVVDVGNRLMEELFSRAKAAAPSYPERTVLVGHVTVMDMAAARQQLVGVVAEHGTAMSHITILAQALGIPAVVGVGVHPWDEVGDLDLLVDGDVGRTWVQPGPLLLQRYESRMPKLRLVEPPVEQAPTAQMRDGTILELSANTGLDGDASPAIAAGAAGIGLFRTEFMYMMAPRFPEVIEQARIYRQVLEDTHPRPVCLRTLDIGGDKELTYFPIQETNPMLGWRGIRVTLDRPALLEDQVTAALRASVGLDNLSLLLPMVTCVSEVRAARCMIDDAVRRLADAGVPVKPPRIGAMIETPSAVYMADAILELVDFVSVGTNDLTQYMLAADRNNPRVADLCDSLHPAVLRAIASVADAARRVGKPATVCGAMAGNPIEVLPLLGMGLSGLSVAAASLPAIRRVIASVAFAEAAALLDEVCRLDTAAAVRTVLVDFVTGVTAPSDRTNSAERRGARRA